MAKAEYGYLHIVSNKLTRKYERDLSDERCEDVAVGRKSLLGEIEYVLEDWGLKGWRGKGEIFILSDG